MTFKRDSKHKENITTPVRLTDLDMVLQDDADDMCNSSPTNVKSKSTFSQILSQEQGANLNLAHSSVKSWHFTFIKNYIYLFIFNLTSTLKAKGLPHSWTLSELSLISSKSSLLSTPIFLNFFFISTAFIFYNLFYCFLLLAIPSASTVAERYF